MTNGNDAAFSRQGFALDADSYDLGASGLTKREVFAAMAMQGILAAQSGDHGYSVVYNDYDTGEPKHVPKYVTMFAKASTLCADALIEALNKPEELK